VGGSNPKTYPQQNFPNLVYDRNMRKKRIEKTVYRSSKTGKFIGKKYAAKNPNTTEKQKVHSDK